MKRYDLVSDLFGNPRTAIMALCTGARKRVGFGFRGRRCAYNLVVAPRGDLVHGVEFNLDALRALHIQIVTRQPTLPIDGLSEASADHFWATNELCGKTVVGLNPAGGWYTKRWPTERFAALGDVIADNLAAVPLLIWGPGERAEAQRSADNMRQNALLIPQSTLPVLAPLLRRLRVLVCNDSGPLHIDRF